MCLTLAAAQFTALVRVIIAASISSCAASRSSLVPDGITVILMRFHFDARKIRRLRANPKRGVGFEEAQEMFSHPYYLDQRSDLP